MHQLFVIVRVSQGTQNPKVSCHDRVMSLHSIGSEEDFVANSVLICQTRKLQLVSCSQTSPLAGYDI